MTYIVAGKYDFNQEDSMETYCLTWSVHAQNLDTDMGEEWFVKHIKNHFPQRVMDRIEARDAIGIDNLIKILSELDGRNQIFGREKSNTYKYFKKDEDYKNKDKPMEHTNEKSPDHDKPRVPYKKGNYENKPAQVRQLETDPSFRKKGIKKENKDEEPLEGGDLSESEWDEISIEDDEWSSRTYDISSDDEELQDERLFQDLEEKENEISRDPMTSEDEVIIPESGENEEVKQPTNNREGEGNEDVTDMTINEGKDIGEIEVVKIDSENEEDSHMKEEYYNMGKAPRLDISIGGQRYTALIDSGAQVSAISQTINNDLRKLRSTVKTLPTPCQQLKGAFGQKSPMVKKQILLEFLIEGYTFEIPCLVIEKLSNEIILGFDFMVKYQCTINVGDGVIQTINPKAQLKIKKNNANPGIEHVAIIEKITVAEEGEEDSTDEQVNELSSESETEEEELNVENIWTRVNPEIIPLIKKNSKLFTRKLGKIKGFRHEIKNQTS